MTQREIEYAKIIEFFWNMDDTEMLRYISQAHIKNLGIVKILSGLPGVLMPYYEVEVIGESNPVYQVRQPKQSDRRWLDMANRK